MPRVVMYRQGQHSHAHAFSLIENMIALAILSIGLLGSGSMVTTALAQLQSNAQRRSAIALGEEFANQLIGAREQIAENKSMACTPGVDTCFSEPAVELWIEHWRRRLVQILPEASVSLSVAEATTKLSYRMDIVWPDRHDTFASEQFEFVLSK